MADAEIRLTVADVRSAGFCSPAFKAWCQTNNVDMRDAVKNGIPLSSVTEGTDAGLDRVIAAARARNAAEVSDGG